MEPANHTPLHRNCPACAARQFGAPAPISPDLLYPEAFQLWLQSRQLGAGGKRVRARYVSDRSLKDFREYHRALVRFFAGLTLREIHSGHLAQYQEDRAAGLLGPTREEALARLGDEAKADAFLARERKRRGEVGPNKIMQEVGMLKCILERAGLWETNIAENYQPLQREEADIRRALTPEEQECFLEIASGREEWSFVYHYSLLALHTTMGTQELRRLRLGDVQLQTGIVLVRSTSAKNKHRIRTIPLTEEAAWALERLLERAHALGSRSAQHYLMPFRVAKDRIVTEHGQRFRVPQYDPARPMSESGIKKPFDEVRCAAGVPWFRPYDWRHTAITRLAEAGTGIPVIMSMAGHVSRRMQQHYTQISEAAKSRALQNAHGGRAPFAKKPPRRVELSTCISRTDSVHEVEGRLGNSWGTDSVPEVQPARPRPPDRQQRPVAGGYPNTKPLVKISLDTV